MVLIPSTLSQKLVYDYFQEPQQKFDVSGCVTINILIGNLYSMNHSHHVTHRLFVPHSLVSLFGKRN